MTIRDIESPPLQPEKVKVSESKEEFIGSGDPPVDKLTSGKGFSSFSITQFEVTASI